VLKNFYPLTPGAAIEVASNLSFGDRRECIEGHGIEDIMSIAIGALSSKDSYYYKAPNGKSAAIGGVEEGGKIWMLCTDLIKEFPRQYARDCVRFMNSRPEKLLWNIVDKRNGTHLKLLRFLGFTFLREFTYGPNQLPFIEFCKIQCACQEEAKTVKNNNKTALTTTMPTQNGMQPSGDYLKVEDRS
jgi:hypothetical protein